MDGPIFTDKDPGMLYCKCGAGPFDGNDGLARHKGKCAIVEQLRRDAKLQSVQVYPRLGEGRAPAVPVASGKKTPVANSLNPPSSPGKNLEAVANTVIAMKGKRLCKQGDAFVLWIPKAYIKDGVIDPRAAYDVVFIKKSSSSTGIIEFPV